MSDQIRLAQLSRLKAKQAIRSKALAQTRRSASPPSGAAGPSVPKSSRNAAAAGDALPALERDPRLGQYFEYDLSKMVNSRGGFLVDDDEGLGEQAAIEKRRQEERERAINGKTGAWEPCMSLVAREDRSLTRPPKDADELDSVAAGRQPSTRTKALAAASVGRSRLISAGSTRSTSPSAQTARRPTQTSTRS
jgi:hypothetical protein